MIFPLVLLGAGAFALLGDDTSPAKPRQPAGPWVEPMPPGPFDAPLPADLWLESHMVIALERKRLAPGCVVYVDMAGSVAPAWNDIATPVAVRHPWVRFVGFPFATEEQGAWSMGFPNGPAPFRWMVRVYSKGTDSQAMLVTYGDTLTALAAALDESARSCP